MKYLIVSGSTAFWMNTAVLMVHCCHMKLVLLPGMYSQFSHTSSSTQAVHWADRTQHKTNISKIKTQHILSSEQIDWVWVSEPVQRNGWNSLVWGTELLHRKRGKEKRWDSCPWHIQAVGQAQVFCWILPWTDGYSWTEYGLVHSQFYRLEYWRWVWESVMIQEGLVYFFMIPL